MPTDPRTGLPDTWNRDLGRAEDPDDDTPLPEPGDDEELLDEDPWPDEWDSLDEDDDDVPYDENDPETW